MQPRPAVAHGDGRAAGLLPGRLWLPLAAMWMNVGGSCLFWSLLFLSVAPLLWLSHLCPSAFLWPLLPALDTPVRQSQEPPDPPPRPSLPPASQ